MGDFSASALSRDAFFWVLQGVCTLHRKPFSMELGRQQVAARYTPNSLICAAKGYGFDSVLRRTKPNSLHNESFPLIAWLKPAQPPGSPTSDQITKDADKEQIAPALVLQADRANVLVIEPGDTSPTTVALTDFAMRYHGQITRITPRSDSGTDPDSEAEARQARKFGFSWFVPELLKHKRLWQEVLLASLVIQLIALATPLFTQTIIDKVVVHRTESTLVVIAVGMAMFMLFSAGLTWLRQYLVLHTGNRVDAVLGSSVFERLFKLPPIYFQHRPTGVIAARLHGVETIREFIASAAVTLVLDLPFLLIFVAIMFYYSVTLTLIVLAILAVKVQPLPTEGTISALNIPHCSIVFDLHQFTEIQAELLGDNGVATEKIKHANLVSFTCLKAFAFDQRFERKDAHDLIYCIEHAPDGMDAVAEAFRKESGGTHGAVIQACLATLRSRFVYDDKTEGYRKDGPVSVAKFELGEGVTSPSNARRGRCVNAKRAT